MRTKLIVSVATLATLAASVVYAVTGFEGHSGPALANDPEDLEHGYVDQDTGLFVAIQLNPAHEEAGRFTVALPGVGLFVPSGVATLTVN
ncbi:MAG: hypothetical protein AB7J35_11635 [Dehalococcoidia bacterium]